MRACVWTLAMAMAMATSACARHTHSPWDGTYTGTLTITESACGVPAGANPVSTFDRTVTLTASVAGDEFVQMGNTCEPMYNIETATVAFPAAGSCDGTLFESGPSGHIAWNAGGPAGIENLAGDSLMLHLKTQVSTAGCVRQVDYAFAATRAH